MENTKPIISVIMPVYNGEKFLKEAIESILNQSFQDFELIIINDASTDNSLNIINKYSDNILYKNKIKIINNKENLFSKHGIVKVLNSGMKIANGKYIARMDADDISLPERFEKQINILEKENATLCGTWAITINEDGKEISKMNYPKTSWIGNKFYLLKGNPFIHPTVMFNKETIQNIGSYKNYKHIEDYELWTRIVPEYKSINIPEYLFKYRIHSNQITRKTNLEMRLKGIKIRFLGLFRLIKSIL
ncbi:MAG: glycosyltransferase [Candidatus Nomurabacteria bacterium]